LLENDLNLLKTSALECGSIAKRFFQCDPKVWDKADDAGPVTEADLAVNVYLGKALRTARPNYGWLSEETDDDEARLECERVFVIDPIDGTRAFIAGQETWAHSLAVVENGEPVVAVVYIPMKDLLFEATKGGGARLNGMPIAPSDIDDIKMARVLTPKRTLQPEHWKNGDIPQFDLHFRSSLAYRLSLIASGEFDAMITLRRTWEWDIAAGTLLVTEAGGTMTDRRGAMPRFNNPVPMIDGVVSASQTLHKSLLNRLA